MDRMGSEVYESHSEPLQERRRRPALPCLGCRRRKIKCDRNKPCRQCSQSRKPKFSFSLDAPTLAAVHGARTAAPISNPGERGLAQSETLQIVQASFPSIHDCPTPASLPQIVGNLEVHRLIHSPSKNSSHPAHGDYSSQQVM